MDDDNICRVGDPPVLPDAAREQIGRTLRSSLDAEAPKPDYLGDPLTPPELEEPLQRLKSRLTAHEQGPQAVEAALQGLLGE